MEDVLVSSVKLQFRPYDAGGAHLKTADETTFVIHKEPRGQSQNRLAEIPFLISTTSGERRVGRKHCGNPTIRRIGHM